jgi:branched-chain amino acid aminotransferase
MAPRAAPGDRWVYHDGAFLRAGEVRLGPGTQGLHYGTGVFEGIRAYLDPRVSCLHILKAAEHYRRMLDSALLLRLRIDHTARELVEITGELLRRNEHRGDVYIRPLAYKLALEPGTAFGVRLRGVSTGLTILSMPMGDYIPRSGIRCAVASWRRIPGSSLPARAKITGGYASNALAVDEATAAGYDDAILLNQRGEVAEASTANVFIVSGGRVVTPGADADLLEGITRAIAIEILRDEIGIQAEQRAVARSELYSADEVFLTGTGCQIVPVTEIDGRPVGSRRTGPLTERVRAVYNQAVRGRDPRYQHWLTPVQLERPPPRPRDPAGHGGSARANDPAPRQPGTAGARS